MFFSDDSDLHLQVNKENFLSAKPFSDGAFGYAWAGVRGSHGVSKGKVGTFIFIFEAFNIYTLQKQNSFLDIRRNIQCVI